MSIKLLVVEDEQLIIQVISRMLADKGYGIQSVRSAEDALARLKDEAFDAVLLDNVLPGMTGLRALSEIARLSRAPILMMTGHFDEEFKKDALLLGAAAFLAKPLDIDALDAEIRKLLPDSR
jgi:two-component system response regulator HydG